MEPRDAEDLMKRFEERHGINSEDTQQPDSAEPTVEQVAADMGVQPETVEIPPTARRAFILFELADGSFGSLPVTGLETSIEEAVYLAQRFLFRATIDMTSRHVVQSLKAQTPKGRVVPMGAPRNIRSDQ